MKESKFDILEAGVSLVEFYRNNPCLAAEDLLNVEMPAVQRLMFEDMWFKNFAIITAGRGVGKTRLNAVLAALQAMLYPGNKVGLLAPSFRQSKHIFAEIEALYSISPIMREACNGRPTYQSDRVYLKFHSSGSRQGSVIEGIPLGDGGKIRGARYYCIVADEFVQIPEEIFINVVQPMGATSANPMERVKKVAQQKELIARGLATEEDFDGSTNKIIMTSSAYYTFNHMYSRIHSYEELIAQGSKKHSVRFISYKDMPDGFIDSDAVTNAKATMPSDQFSMEWEGKWISDSSGVFKASLIDKCQRSAHHTVKLSGESDKKYVLGCDPARTSDAFALCLIELGTPNKLVAAWEYYNTNFPAMAEYIMEICSNYNVVAVHLDAGGGGLAVKDLLAEEARFGNKRILDLEDETTIGLEGRRILTMANFSPRLVADANYASLSLMEKDNLTFPRRPTTEGADLEAKEEMYATIDKLTRQLLLIQVTENKTGTAHFDVPTGGGHAKQKKDLYTSFILASKKVYDLILAEQNPGDLILNVGIVQPLRTPEFLTPVDLRYRKY